MWKPKKILELEEEIDSLKEEKAFLAQHNAQLKKELEESKSTKRKCTEKCEACKNGYVFFDEFQQRTRRFCLLDVKCKDFVRKEDEKCT